MPALYAENVPEDLYEALRTRAREHRQSITAEVLALLAANVPTATELSRRKAFLKHAAKIRSRSPRRRGAFPSSEEMQRQDRAR